MAIHIESFTIGHFRGIHHLTVENLNHVNIVAGDNNSGKTSVLEALLLLRDPSDFNNILRLARMRDTNIFFNGASLYECFINLFPRDSKEMEITIDAICNGVPVMYDLIGKEKTIMIDTQDAKELFVKNIDGIRHGLRLHNSEVETFQGDLIWEIAEHKREKWFEINPYTSISGREIKKNSFLNIVYLSPMDHVYGNNFNRILKYHSYKDVCLRVLQIFDPDIIDLLILKDENSNRSIEYIKHATFGNMPLSTYGDGIKKVLSLANGIAKAAGGILLIDEVETAIHSKYYDDIFRFIVKACIQFDVQAFITTHSIEAIDALLATQDYDKQSETDHISVLTFKKESSEKKTYSRVLLGRNVYSNREQFDFEVRL